LNKHNTNEAIQTALLIRINKCLNFHTKQEIPDTVAHIFDIQTSLGWKLVLRGLLANEWSNYQYQQICSFPSDNKHMTGDTWNKHILQEAHKLWKIRCDNDHDTNNASNNNRDNIIAQLRQMYDNIQQIPENFRNAIFSNTLEEQIQRTTKQIQDWIQRNNDVIKYATTKTIQNITQRNTRFKYWGNTPRKKQTKHNIVKNGTSV
jgi:hypothetical protein